MMVSLNGELVPEKEAVVSVFDRAFRYGDGLFETILISNGQVFRWEAHIARLLCSLQFLKIQPRWDSGALKNFATELIYANAVQDGLLRLQVSRGSGQRGYAPQGTETPVLVLSTHDLPPAKSWKLAVSSFRVSAGDPLLQHKTTSRLLNVLAAAEARDAGADEAVMLDCDGKVTEGAISTLCWVEGGRVVSTPVSAAVLPGITRKVVWERCAALAISTEERLITLDELRCAEGVFCCVSSRGVVEVTALDNQPVSSSPVIARLQHAWREAVRVECGGVAQP